MGQKIIIVGGVGGGATVAAQIRRKDKESQIIIFDKGDHIAFSNCGMPYYIGEVVKERDDLLVPTDTFIDKYDVTIRTNCEVTGINRSTKQIHYKSDAGTYEETYDKLILSPGASASIPTVEGMKESCMFPLHTIPDMDDIYSYIKKEQPKTVAIVGAGFIGLEMVENLHALGLDCTIIDRSDQVMKLVDKNMAAIVEDHLEEKDVTLILDDGMESYSDDGKTIHLNSGDTVQADMTILATGVKPNTSLASDASLKLGSTGAIAVNDYMQTTDPNIYALGDAIETKGLIIEEPRHVALAWPAHRQAFIIASHLNGEAIAYKGTMGSAILKIFDLTVGATGNNSTSLKQSGYTFKEATLQSYSHTGYYPGSDKLWLKVLFDENTGQLYGAHVVGFDGADKRLAVLTTAIKAKLTVADLPELELAYAPPYSSAKDPVNILGYKASSMLD
ncbi:NADPH-dependent 2,4-dienoyl-CoA reductase/sulfur reductase-like enzyme [Virgibacillus natechei]|uniref:NADPH-dependent 2,4-dienoyl-CoA reductase/sulfur reductase-like enzyme n=1 Tax=Virgibacillus natechei TaxID=1216297 RepID=A0ABS4II70_9BACI|nr:CoA-disulfide reductase [Virgibacillus natechei]MBP1970642.1 NADPH-dependent 2,4-dienoyl-CoA reductase/sulfur reductase-like enzyme [Virgibacillus natechei]UZD13971.1 CoA-disulfide reductase [Virgibacillus natechei]